MIRPVHRRWPAKIKLVLAGPVLAGLALAASTPLYSMTTAAERRLAWVIDTAATAPETLGATQISVVVPVALLAWAARDQLAPVWAMPDTLLSLVPRVEITATSVLPATGAALIVTLKLVLELVPVFPVALRTRIGVT